MIDIFPGLAVIIVLTVGALLYLVVEASPIKRWSRPTIALLSATIAVAFWAGSQGSFYLSGVMWHSLFFDPLSWGFSLLILLALLFTLILASSRAGSEGIDDQSEYYCLMLLATVGALVFVSSAHLLVLYVGMELMSLALYPLVAGIPGLKQSSEAGLKYFTLGAFSSALMLYGIALLYGFTGSLEIVAVFSEPVMESMGGAFALGLLLAGLLFKLGAFPLHFWLADVYQGAPFSVTIFMATVVKVAAVGILSRIVFLLASESLLVWEGFLWTAAVVTMIIGNVCALRQDSVKRLLAFSSVGHAGYMLVGILGNDIFPTVSYYLLGYVFTTLGVFAVLVCWARDRDDLRVSDLAGAGWSSPLLAVCLSMFVLGLAGLPPGLVGVFGKLFVFQEAARTGYPGLVVIACLCSTVGCYYYLRVIAVMWLEKPVANVQLVGSFDRNSLVALVSLVVTTMIGVCPEMIYPALVNLFEFSTR